MLSRIIFCAIAAMSTVSFAAVCRMEMDDRRGTGEISEPKEDVCTIEKEEPKTGEFRIVARLGKYRVQRFTEFGLIIYANGGSAMCSSNNPFWNSPSFNVHDNKEDAQAELDDIVERKRIAETPWRPVEYPEKGDFRIITKLGWYRPQRFTYSSWSDGCSWAIITRNDFKTKEEAQCIIDDIVEEERIAAIPWVTVVEDDSNDFNRSILVKNKQHPKHGPGMIVLDGIIQGYVTGCDGGTSGTCEIFTGMCGIKILR